MALIWQIGFIVSDGDMKKRQNEILFLVRFLFWCALRRADARTSSLNYLTKAIKFVQVPVHGWRRYRSLHWVSSVSVQVYCELLARVPVTTAKLRIKSEKADA